MSVDKILTESAPIPPAAAATNLIVKLQSPHPPSAEDGNFKVIRKAILRHFLRGHTEVDQSDLRSPCTLSLTAAAALLSNAVVEIALCMHTDDLYNLPG